MRALPDQEELERPPVNSKRQEVERQLAVIETKARMLAERHGRLAAGIAIAAAAAFGVGLMGYRRRQRKSGGRRGHPAIPDSVWGPPEGLGAQLKKPPQPPTETP